MQRGCVHYTFQPISRSLAILTMVNPPQLHHCWDSHFVPYRTSGKMAILPMVDPPWRHHCWNSHFVPYWISDTLAISTMVDPPLPPWFSPYIRRWPWASGHSGSSSSSTSFGAFWLEPPVNVSYSRVIDSYSRVIGKSTLRFLPISSTAVDSLHLRTCYASSKR